MLELQRQRLRAKLVQMDAALRKRPAEAVRIERRIGPGLGAILPPNVCWK